MALANTQRVFAYDCKALDAVHFALQKHSNSFAWASRPPYFDSKRLTKMFLDELDPMKLYLMQNDVTKIESLLEDISFGDDFLQNICSLIMNPIGNIYKKRVDEMQSLMSTQLSDSLFLLDESATVSSQKIRMFVNRNQMNWSLSLFDRNTRWKNRLLFERYKFFDYSFAKFYSWSNAFFREHHYYIGQDHFLEAAFVRALVKFVQFKDTVFLNFKNIRVLSEEGYAYRHLAKYTDYQDGMGSMKCNFTSPIYLDFVSIKSRSLCRLHFFIGDKNDIGPADKLVNFYDQFKSSNGFLYIRKEKKEYVFDRLYAVPTAYKVHDIFFRSMYMFPQTHSGAIKKKRIGYLYPGALFSVNSDVYSRLGKIVSTALQAETPVSMMILDLRSSRIGNMKKAMNLLEVFLPNTPVFQIKDSTGNARVLSTKSPHMVFKGGVVALVDTSTSFYSALIAQVLQDYGRAVVVGEGLGSTTGAGPSRNQKVFIGQGGISWLLVVSGWVYSLRGKLLEGRGMRPDFSLPLRRDNSRFINENMFSRKDVYEFFADKQISDASNNETKRVEPTIIETLKQRSHERLLHGLYDNPHFIDHKNVYQSKVSKWRGFEESFGLTKHDLMEERAWHCEGSHCHSVSLDAKVFAKRMKQARYRHRYMQHVLNSNSPSVAESFSLFCRLVKNDVTLKEMFYIATDYEQMLRDEPSVRYDFQKSCVPAKKYQ